MQTKTKEYAQTKSMTIAELAEFLVDRDLRKIRKLKQEIKVWLK